MLYRNKISIPSKHYLLEERPLMKAQEQMLEPQVPCKAHTHHKEKSLK